MISCAAFALLACVPAAVPQDESAPATAPGDLVFGLGEGLPELVIPRDEELVFEATVSAAVIETTLGMVTLSAGVDPFRPGLLLPTPDEQARSGLETGWLKARAKGKHILYEMDAWIESRFLPQDWPRLRYYYEHRGTENRRREVLIGDVDGVQRASYRSEKNHGGWGAARERRLPRRGAVETLGAIYLVRTLIAEDKQRLRFPLLTKLDLWDVTLTRGEERVIRTDAGRFAAVKIELATEWHPSNGPDHDGEKFEGLFGIHGTIDIWVDRETGVPVLVLGDIPAGPIQVRAVMSLSSYRGTPEGFAPLPD